MKFGVVELFAFLLIFSNITCGNLSPTVTINVLYPDILKEVMPEGVQSIVLMRGKRHNNLNFDGVAHLASPMDGCESYYGAGDKQGGTGMINSRSYIYVVSESGNCAISTKIHFAQKANAQALILVHSDDNLQEVNQ